MRTAMCRSIWFLLNFESESLSDPKSALDAVVPVSLLAETVFVGLPLEVTTLMVQTDLPFIV